MPLALLFALRLAGLMLSLSKQRRAASGATKLDLIALRSKCFD